MPFSRSTKCERAYKRHSTWKYICGSVYNWSNSGPDCRSLIAEWIFTNSRALGDSMEHLNRYSAFDKQSRTVSIRYRNSIFCRREVILMLLNSNSRQTCPNRNAEKSSPIFSFPKLFYLNIALAIMFLHNQYCSILYIHHFFYFIRT